MYEIKIPWNKFKPHALPIYSLWHPKGTPKRSIIRDYICLDTETSKGVPDPEEDCYFDESVLLPKVANIKLYVPEYVRENTDFRYIRKIFRKSKIKLSEGGYNISELYDTYKWILDDVNNEIDQLKAIAHRLEYEQEKAESRADIPDHDIGWIYQWCFSYPLRNGDRWLVYGRKPSQLAYCLKQIADINRLDNDNKMLVYCHNMSYDWQFFHAFLQDEFGEDGEILAVGAHRLINYQIGGLEFRDSLKVSNKGLAKWGKELNIKHKKLTELIDYSVQRYQDSKLYKNDWRYMFRDVISLDECIAKQMELWADNTKSIPLTSTGYVRRETRKEFKKEKANREYFLRKKLTLDTYRFCRSEFAGGLTHGNRFRAGRTITVEKIKELLGREDVIIRHRDFVSHYPSQQICKYCPGSKFALYYDHLQDEKRKALHVNDLLAMDDKCILASIQIWDLELRDGVTLPYAQECKILAGQREKLDLVCDNGRVIKMLSGSSVVVLNELDLKWYKKQYKFKFKILQVYTASRAPFPRFLTDTVIKYFVKKTKLKNELKEIEKKYGRESDQYRELKIQEQIAKAMLNGIYGMSATDIVRSKFFETESGIWDKEVLTADMIEDRINKYYSGKKNFMNYELGLWTTAHARDELLTFCELIGYEYYLYADTDSLFYISTPEIEDLIEAKNKEFRNECDKNGWYITLDGKKTYFHQFDDEGEDIIKFRFLHAKCYAYVTSDGQLHATIAGVPEKSGDMTRVKELGDINNLLPGTVFKSCGGTVSKYPPRFESNKPRIETVNGHDLEVSSYVLIENTTKELKCSIEREEEPIFWEVIDCYE